MLALRIFRCFALLLNSSALSPLNQPQHPHWVAATAPSPSLLQGSTEDHCGCSTHQGDFPPNPSPVPVPHWALHPINFPFNYCMLQRSYLQSLGNLIHIRCMIAWASLAPNENEKWGGRRRAWEQDLQLSSSGNFPPQWLCWLRCTIHRFHCGGSLLANTLAQPCCNILCTDCVVWAGWTCSKCLAEKGEDVIKKNNTKNVLRGWVLEKGQCHLRTPNIYQHVPKTEYY